MGSPAQECPTPAGVPHRSQPFSINTFTPVSMNAYDSSIGRWHQKRLSMRLSALCGDILFKYCTIRNIARLCGALRLLQCWPKCPTKFSTMLYRINVQVVGPIFMKSIA